MKKVKMLLFAAVLGVVSLVSISSVNAAGWASTLNLDYGTIHSGASRWYGTGTHRINISVDGFNRANGTVRKSGTTTMAVELWDVGINQSLKYDKSTFIYATCADRTMGSFSSGYRYYTFFSKIYNWSTDAYDDYDGVKSNAVYMYPLP